MMNFSFLFSVSKEPNDVNEKGNHLNAKIINQQQKYIINMLKSIYRWANNTLIPKDDFKLEIISQPKSEIDNDHLELRKDPYNPADHINVAEYLGIKNEKGIVVKREVSKEEKVKFIKEKVELDDNTMKYFEFYRYADALIEKLYKTLKNNA